MASNSAREPLVAEILSNNIATATIGDVLDRLGYHQCFLAPDIKPLVLGRRIVGRAMPVLQADLQHPTSDPEERPFGKLFEALDDLKPGEVFVATGSTSQAYALFGGLMATRARYLDAAGAILDGYVRDAHEIEALDFPVCSRGLYAQDQGARGKCIDYRCTVRIGAVTITPGDLLIADDEGVVVVPREAESQVVRLAIEKANTESGVAIAIKEGIGANDAYSRFGVF